MRRPLGQRYAPSWLYWYVTGVVYSIVFVVWLLQPLHGVRSALLTFGTVGIIALLYRRVVTHTYGPASQPNSSQQGIVSSNATVSVPRPLLRQVKSKMSNGTEIMLVTRRHHIFFYLRIARIAIAAPVLFTFMLWVLNKSASSSMGSFQLIHHALLCVTILVPVATATVVIVERVRWGAWCLVITNKEILLCEIFPPELPWMKNTTVGVKISDIGFTGTSVGFWGKILDPPFGDLKIDTSAQADIAFNKVTGVPDVDMVRFLINDLRK